jgi:transitional endoplasmic reticulum ATPase
MPKKDAAKELELTVAEALQIDVGRGIARIDSQTMEALGVSAGDAIVIKGKYEAVAVVWRARPEDEGKGIIRLDGITRFNAGATLEDKVKVRKVETKEAKELSIAPLEEVRFSGDPEPYFRDKLLDKVFVRNNKLVIDLFGTTLHYVVTKTKPSGYVRVTENTRILISEKTVKEEELRMPAVTYEDIGGLKEEIAQIREMVELPMKHPEVFERLGIGAPKGVLLSGPPGCGKTLLAKAVASETESAFYAINGPEIMSKWYGESEKQLRDIFAEAEKNAPSIIFIDEIDAIAPKREEVTGEVERRVVSQLLTLMDGLKGRGQVVVIAATNRPDAIDPALRRPGRFDREIVIGVPDMEARREILQIHTRGMPLAKDVDLDWLAEKTLGFTGADIEALCKEAAMKALREFAPKLKQFEERIPTHILEKIVVKMKHFKDALKHVEPSAMREVLFVKPKVRWRDIGGLEEAKQVLKESVEWPLRYPQLFERVGIRPPKGVLLYGPPGCGKTLLAKAIANEADANFISVKGPELLSKWVGESEKHVRDIFKKARQVAHSIIFFDEFDAISKVRGSSLTDATERVVNQLLTELDGIEELEKVIVIAATNRPDLIDPSLLRPGRIELHVPIPMPDEKARYEIFKVHTRNMPLAKDVDLKKLAKMTGGFNGAFIEAVCREAGMNALRETVKKRGFKSKKKPEIEVKMRHFNTAVNKIKKRFFAGKKATKQKQQHETETLPLMTT